MNVSGLINLRSALSSVLVSIRSQDIKKLRKEYTKEELDEFAKIQGFVEKVAPAIALEMGASNHDIYSKRWQKAYRKLSLYNA